MSERNRRPHVPSVLLIACVVVGVVAPAVGAVPAESERPAPDGVVERTVQAGAVDVTGLDVPSEATTGEPVEAGATVENAGDTTATVTLEYRIDGQVVATVEVTLAPGESRTLTLSGTVPALAAGTYQQGVFVGGTENGRTASLSVREPPAPVFAISDFRGPVQVRTGEAVTAEAVVGNTGDATGTTEIQYRIGDQVVASRNLRIDARETQTVTLSGTVPSLAPGSYRQGVYVGDQARTTSLEVRPRTTPRAVFAVRRIRAPGEVTVGDQVSVKATVRNVGNASGSTALEYRIEEQVLATRRVQLDPGAETTVTFDARVPDLPTGSYLQGVYLAGTDEGEEADMLVSAGPPRFVVSDVRGPPSATVGERIAVRATVTNTGRSTGSTELQYRLDGQVLASESVELGPGANRTVTLRATVPDLSAGTYAQGVFLGGTDRGQTTSIVLEREPTPTPTPTSGSGGGFTVLLAVIALLVTGAASTLRRRRGG